MLIDKYKSKRFGDIGAATSARVDLNRLVVGRLKQWLFTEMQNELRLIVQLRLFSIYKNELQQN